MKLYYNDVLKAAWMSQEFGVYFENDITSFNCYALSTGQETPHFFHVDTKREIYKLNIHPRSLDIFKPQIGDLVIVGGNYEPVIDWIDKVMLEADRYPDRYSDTFDSMPEKMINKLIYSTREEDEDFHEIPLLSTSTGPCPRHKDGGPAAKPPKRDTLASDG